MSGVVGESVPVPQVGSKGVGSYNEFSINEGHRRQEVPAEMPATEYRKSKSEHDRVMQS